MKKAILEFVGSEKELELEASGWLLEERLTRGWLETKIYKARYWGYFANG